MIKILVRLLLVAITVGVAHTRTRAAAQEVETYNHKCDCEDGCSRCAHLFYMLRPRERVTLPYRQYDVPFGSSANAILQTQKDLGRAAITVLYHFDFNADGTLNRGGDRRLAHIADSLQSHPYPIIIQPVANDAASNAARKRAVVKGLKKQSFPVPDERVVIGQPPARGLHGIHAILIHDKLLKLESTSGRAAVPSSAARIIPRARP